MKISELYRSQIPVAGGVTPTPVDGKSGLGKTKPVGEHSDFNKMLQESALKLSQHAETRIKSRDIPWGPDIQKRILQGIDSAESKGSREALILADEVAVIANIKSKTVITAMDKSEMKEKIFTNIDSAVLV
jgi:flagellar operon protein